MDRSIRLVTLRSPLRRPATSGPSRLPAAGGRPR
jgi:hypothetical protein